MLNDVPASHTAEQHNETYQQAWISGQNSDGFGEGLEQREFEIDDGEGYLSFWNSGDNYFMVASNNLAIFQI